MTSPQITREPTISRAVDIRSWYKMVEEESDELYLGRLGTVTQKGSRTRESCRMMVQQTGQVEGPSGGHFRQREKRVQSQRGPKQPRPMVFWELK